MSKVTIGCLLALSVAALLSGCGKEPPAPAAAVMDYLHNAGIGDNQFTAVGFGESRPIASNDTDAGRAANRRVVLKRTDCK